MQTNQSIYTPSRGWTTTGNSGHLQDAQLVLLFGSKELLKERGVIDEVRSFYPAAHIAGCSTAGEICGEELFDNTVVCTAVWFEKTRIETVKATISAMEESFSAGARMAVSLNKEQLLHVMIFSEGLNINGSELVKGLYSILGNRVTVTGGLAGDQADFIETVVVDNAAGESNAIIAIGFYGENLKVGYGSLGGWDSFGVDREVTKSNGNVLYELDGQPALELYKKYLGAHASGLPASALLFPLSLQLKETNTPLVRTVLSVNEKDGSMVFAGDIPQGEKVRLMKANFERLIQGANDAAEMSKLGVPGTDPDLAILISCVGRKLVLKQRIEEELEAVREVLGEACTMTGFYSYGEICPMKPVEQKCELHNQTMTITVFKEI